MNIEKIGRYLSSGWLLLAGTAVAFWGYSSDLSKLNNGGDLSNFQLSPTTFLFFIPFAISVILITIYAVIDTLKDEEPFGLFSLGPWFSSKFFLIYTVLTFSINTPFFIKVFGVLAVLSGIALLGRIGDFLSDLDSSEARISRPNILASKDNIQAVKSSLSEQSKGVYCGDIADGAESHELHVSTQDRGIVIGPPGTGKTAFMVTQLLDWAEKKGSFVCLDIKPELNTILREKLDEQGYRVFVFNPSSTVDRYNLLDDIDGATAIGELASSLVPSSDGDTRAFDEGARDIIDGIISYLRSEGRAVSLPAMRDFLGQYTSETELIQTLSQSKDPDVRDIAFALARSAKNSRFIGSVFATLRANLRFLRYDSIRDSISSSDFSLSYFLDDRPVALFLQFEERRQEVTRLLLTATISHLFNYFIEHTDRPPVLLMLDEVGNVPRIPGLVEKLNTIRSRKLPTWMYWQGIQQMQKYGEKANEGVSSIMAACDFHMAFRLNDNDSAYWFSDRIGTTDRDVYSNSHATGKSSKGYLFDTTHTSSDSVTHQVKEEPILKIADLQSLPFGKSIAIYRGMAWHNLATPYFERWPEMGKTEVSETKIIEPV